jgi:C-methyltransferase C-terminal domain/Methyltransferase domain
VTILPRQFADADAEWKPDLVCCRHVLEHVPDPVSLLEQAGRLAGWQPETVVFFEVPNVLHTLEELAIWDVIYEHCLYLSPRSLERLFAAAGFAVIATREVYEGQFLTIEARPAGVARTPGGKTGSSELDDIDRRRPTGGRPAPARTPNDTDRLGPLTATFARHHEQKIARWRDVLAEVERDGDTAVLWGAGSKAVTFLNVLEVDERVVPCVVDINPRKQGCHVPGTGQMIVPPSRLADIRPRLVIVMNPVYRAEIEADLRRHEVRSSILIA